MKLSALIFMVVVIVICLGGFIWSLTMSVRKK